jgi:uncharacterized membrane protein
MATETKMVSLGRAFGYCFSKGSYWISFIFGIVCLIAGLILGVKRYNTQADVDTLVLVFWGAGVVIFFMCLLLRPIAIHANTTEEQANRGVWIS